MAGMLQHNPPGGGVNQLFQAGTVVVYTVDENLDAARARGVQTLADAANQFAADYIEEARVNALHFGLELANAEVRTRRAIPLGTLVGLGIGSLHVKNWDCGNALGDGVPYRVRVDLRPHFNDLVNLQLHPANGRGVLEGNLPFNLFLSTHVCRGQNIQMTWRRLSFAEPERPPPALWLLCGHASRRIFAGERLLHNINECCGFNENVCLSGPFAEMMAVMYHQETSRCVCENPCPTRGVFVTGPISDSQREIARGFMMIESRTRELPDSLIFDVTARVEGRRMSGGVDGAAKVIKRNREEGSRSAEPDASSGAETPGSPSAKSIRCSLHIELAGGGGAGWEPRRDDTREQRSCRGGSDGKRPEKSNV